LRLQNQFESPHSKQAVLRGKRISPPRSECFLRPYRGSNPGRLANVFIARRPHVPEVGLHLRRRVDYGQAVCCLRTLRRGVNYCVRRMVDYRPFRLEPDVNLTNNLACEGAGKPNLSGHQSARFGCRVWDDSFRAALMSRRPSAAPVSANVAAFAERMAFRAPQYPPPLRPTGVGGRFLDSPFATEPEPGAVCEQFLKAGTLLENRVGHINPSIHRVPWETWVCSVGCPPTTNRPTTEHPAPPYTGVKATTRNPRLLLSEIDPVAKTQQ